MGIFSALVGVLVGAAIVAATASVLGWAWVQLIGIMAIVAIVGGLAAKAGGRRPGGRHPLP